MKVPDEKVAARVALTVRVDEDAYRDMRLLCGKLCIPVQEFLRRAVARELAYSDSRGSKKKDR